LPAVRRPRRVRLCRRLRSGGSEAGDGGGSVEVFGDLLGGPAAAGQLCGVGIQVVATWRASSPASRAPSVPARSWPMSRRTPRVRSCAEMRLR